MSSVRNCAVLAKNVRRVNRAIMIYHDCFVARTLTLFFYTLHVVVYRKMEDGMLNVRLSSVMCYSMFYVSFFNNYFKKGMQVYKR